MAEPVIDWNTATVKVSVVVVHTVTSERQEVEFPISVVFEQIERLNAALGAAVTALELIIDGEQTQSAEELVEILLYPEHFGLAERMKAVGGETWKRIDIARGEAVFGS